MDSVAADAHARHGRHVRVRGCLLILFAWLAAAQAWADGPHIAFHETAGAYTVTLFSAPDPLLAGPIGLTLLVQNAGTGVLLPSVQAAGQLQLAGQAPVAFTLEKSAGEGGLPAATVTLPQAGTYALEFQISADGGVPVRFNGALPVTENHGQRNTVLWAVFLPAAAVALFLLNQYGKAQLRRRLG